MFLYQCAYELWLKMTRSYLSAYLSFLSLIEAYLSSAPLLGVSIFSFRRGLVVTPSLFVNHNGSSSQLSCGELLYNHGELATRVVNLGFHPLKRFKMMNLSAFNLLKKTIILDVQCFIPHTWSRIFVNCFLREFHRLNEWLILICFRDFPALPWSAAVHTSLCF